ncbi:hypothetical protein [Phaeocystidibacter marisrubri]|uniref:Uncharacterized protein n=1 Tax=Phaeocystidibacter marisrubri TaxID=1577780 RepID=A0A6L3ZET3_9FLAO|nr:hypothetical protein [Phaeocystidibacter marisrubri]KAB2815180.1 hypothetical protein F8C82_13870 [Phaeocystidibacter marisrubri]GGH70743.1 hypothetical protein GCM10011318_13060 [Phaeocystidibacter marisrubri]
MSEGNAKLRAIGAVLLIVLLGVGVAQCSSKRKIEDGVNVVIRNHAADKNYSILLADMDFRDDKYYHKYDVILMDPDSTFREEHTDWMEVSPPYFQRCQNAMGMEVASCVNGKVEQNIAPPGYSNHVGNPHYGRWHGGYWIFFSRYSWLGSRYRNSYYRPDYNSYNTYSSSYRAHNRDYYGQSGKYGTSAYTSTQQGKSTTWGGRSPQFKNNVRSQVKRSATRYTRSSTRSRSGGFGK